jgi:hypothetical protein
MSHRRGQRRRRPDRVEVLAKRLPAEFRSFGDWLYHEDGQPTGLRRYVEALETWISEELGKPPEVGAALALKVMTAAGITPADWYAAILGGSRKQLR